MNQFVKRQLNRSGRFLRKLYFFYEQSIIYAKTQKQFSKMPDFKKLLDRISQNAIVSSEDILLYISQESLSDRLWVNLKLAEAFYAAGTYYQAKVFIQRAWEFSEFDEKYLSLFIKIHAGIDDVETIRKAHKALGMKKADERKIVEALNHFNDWQNSFAIHRGLDDYQYDYEILNKILELGKPYSHPTRKLKCTKNRKIRLAYLMFGMLHSNSVIVKISLLFAKYHDPSRFEVTFYVPELSSKILENQEATNNIKIINELGWNVVLAPGTTEEISLINLSGLIYEYNPDILITSAALADLKHYFLTSLRPAPLIIGLCQGPAPQFIAPNFDWSITWFKSLLIDCPINCTWINLRLDLPERIYSREVSKSFFGVSKDTLVIMSAGRPAKFRNEDFWKAIIDLLRTHSNVCYIAVGLAGMPPRFLSELLSPDIIERVKILGWEKDFHKVLSMADVVVDTYPSGGGVVIKDAMALGVPVISFKHDYMKTFSQMECSAAEEVIGIPELLIERDDFLNFKKVLSKLLIDHKYRDNLSQICAERIKVTSSNPKQMIKDCEQVYLRVIENNCT